ncbi:hypothetical protein FQN54_009783 [Arachnomyces sp. PD_36]|nr:hypothetical protein FQN54_009783 [Arachnomyces sp. PD_36]
MSASTFNEEWLRCPTTARDSGDDILTWTTSISRTGVSTVDGLRFSEHFDVDGINSLENLLRTIQRLKLKKLSVDQLEEMRFVAAGETFAVSECKLEGEVVAVKRIRLNEDGKNFDRQHFQRRLQAVLREVLIMCHPPLSYHPNIVSLLGYGWTFEEQRPSPFISVEFASEGSLRAYMRHDRSIKTKLILAGDVAAGLMALHKCGIVHGDLKMDNVVVFMSLDRPSMSIAKLSDFGHSILASSTPEKRTHYFGTSLYNAPEVAEQKDQPIPVEDLHKCDIWAFGLCVWEILADGKVYFQRSWRSNPIYARPSSSIISTLTPSSDSHDRLSSDVDDQHVLGSFDPSHLKALANEFVNSLWIPGMGLEKGFLRPLLERTLQVDPAKRISDLSRLPIIGFWNKTPGGHSLQWKLATYSISGDIRYSIFSKDSGYHIFWNQQQELLQDFEAVALRSRSPKYDSAAAFQTMLCYVNAFGTSRNYTKSTEFLRRAEESGHLVARILAPRILDAFSPNPCTTRQSYSECIALGFRTIRDVQQSFTTSYNGEPTGKFEPQGQSTLVQAARIGYSALVKRLLEAGSSLADNDTTSLLHWLFCLDDQSLCNIQQILSTSTAGRDLPHVLNHATSEKVILHPQWPFQVYGTPLATAISSGSVAAVKTLLALGADPLAPAFPTGDSEFLTNCTPIHLAVRYHFPEMFQLLWRSAFGERPATLPLVRGVPALVQHPVACALSFLTNAERFAIHGSSYIQNLRSTIQLFPTELLFQASPEGTTAITQAIDLEDVDTVELLLDNCPELAWRKLEEPGKNNSYTYPLHLAAQFGSYRDTEESLQIIKSILRLDPTAINKPDSSSFKPLHLAAMGSSFRITTLLLERGASIDDRDKRGQGPLHFCRVSSNVDVLLQSGALIDEKDNMGLTAAHAAVNRGAEEVLRALIAAGANLDITSNENQSLLHCAILRKSRSAAETLLKAGIAIDMQDIHGRTPLQLAMDAGRSDLALLLVEYGADPFIEDRRGSSSFRLALAWGNPLVLARFYDHKGFNSLSQYRRTRILHFASKDGEPEALRQYLHKLPVSLFDAESDALYNKKTPVHTSAIACRPELVQVLLSCGFKVDALDAEGNTPLLSACQAGRLQAAFPSHRRTSMCEQLLGNGADMLARNYKGWTPLLVAQDHEDYPLLTLLLRHALALNDADISQESESKLGREGGIDLYKDALALTGGEILKPKLIQDAAIKGEWDFIMTCIAGHFVHEVDFQDIFKFHNTNVDPKLWRFYSIEMDRDMMQYLYTGKSLPRSELSSPRYRDFEKERAECEDTLGVRRRQVSLLLRSEARNILSKRLGKREPMIPAIENPRRAIPRLLLNGAEIPVTLDDLSGTYSVRPSSLGDYYWHISDGSHLKLCISSSGSRMWGLFSFEMFKLILRSQKLDKDSRNGKIKFHWRQVGEGMFTYDLGDIVLTFSDDGRIIGHTNGNHRKTFEFWGEKNTDETGNKAALSREITSWKDEYRELDVKHHNTKIEDKTDKLVEYIRKTRLKQSQKPPQKPHQAIEPPATPQSLTADWLKPSRAYGSTALTSASDFYSTDDKRAVKMGGMLSRMYNRGYGRDTGSSDMEMNAPDQIGDSRTRVNAKKEKCISLRWSTCEFLLNLYLLISVIWFAINNIIFQQQIRLLNERLDRCCEGKL